MTPELLIDDDALHTDEKETLHVLRNPDGSVFAALMLTAPMAEKINERRRSRGLINGEWKPEESHEQFWYLDNTSKGFLKEALPIFFTRTEQEEGANGLHATTTN